MFNYLQETVSPDTSLLHQDVPDNTCDAPELSWTDITLTDVTVCVFSRSVMSHTVIPWTVVHQAPLSMEFSRQEYQSRSPFPIPGDLPDPGIEPISYVSPTVAGGFFTTEPPWKPFDLSKLENETMV